MEEFTRRARALGWVAEECVQAPGAAQDPGTADVAGTAQAPGAAQAPGTADVAVDDQVDVPVAVDNQVDVQVAVDGPAPGCDMLSSKISTFNINTMLSNLLGSPQSKCKYLVFVSLHSSISYSC